MDIPDHSRRWTLPRDHDTSDEEDSEPELPNEVFDDPSLNLEEEDKETYEASLALIDGFQINLEEDKTPIDPGTGHPLFTDPPPLPRIKELREATISSPPIRRRTSTASKELPHEVNTPKNSPEKMSTECHSPCASEFFGKQLDQSLPSCSKEAMKMRSLQSHRAPANPFLLGGSHVENPTPSVSNPKQGLRIKLMSVIQSTLRANVVSEALPESTLGANVVSAEALSESTRGAANVVSAEALSESTRGAANVVSAEALPESTLGANVVSAEALPESTLGANVVSSPAIQQTKRTLEKSPSERGDSGSPSDVKRNRRVPATVPEGRPADDQRRRRLSHEARGTEPEVKRKPRKRTYTTGGETTEIKEKQRKDK